jgi:hypothetical protein
MAMRAIRLEVEVDPNGNDTREIRWELTEDEKIINGGIWPVPDNLETDASASWVNLMRVLLDR